MLGQRVAFGQSNIEVQTQSNVSKDKITQKIILFGDHKFEGTEAGMWVLTQDNFSLRDKTYSTMYWYEILGGVSLHPRTSFKDFVVYLGGGLELAPKKELPTRCMLGIKIDDRKFFLFSSFEYGSTGGLYIAQIKYNLNVQDIPKSTDWKKTIISIGARAQRWTGIGPTIGLFKILAKDESQIEFFVVPRIYDIESGLWMTAIYLKIGF